jgi:hypothetical protein
MNVKTATAELLRRVALLLSVAPCGFTRAAPEQ